MKIIQPSAKIEIPVNGTEIVKQIEKIGRVCYKSEDKITPNSAERFIKMILQNGHESVIEHSSVSMRVICDRGVSHEIVRHRIASYSQESTRYCNYGNGQFNHELTFIMPCYFDESHEHYYIWYRCMEQIEHCYLSLIASGASPQEARAVLPNSLKTELVMTMNLREWRHFIRLRTSNKAHPQMRQVATLILAELKNQIPIIFDEFHEEDEQ